MKKRFFAFSIFLTVFFLLILIAYLDTYSAINDYITSTLLSAGFIFAFAIYLINIKFISGNRIIQIIKHMPDYLPFSHAIKNYLLSLIKVEYKVIVLLRTLDEKNHEWVLNQIAAYNNLFQDNSQFANKQAVDVEFICINRQSDDIHHMMKNFQVLQYNYIILTSLSDIFRQTILTRENLPQENKCAIKIIGALSSINDKSIQSIINKDDNIIRIFPPDYDEAKTAMEFIFSKIKSSICAREGCQNYHKKNNIIILHNGTYGRAVTQQCKVYYDKELSTIYNYTIPELSPTDLGDSIEFHSFDYKHNDQVLYDNIDSSSFELFLDTWQERKNYFFIIGYEPNISNIIEFLDRKLHPYPAMEKCLIFSGTASMKSWRESIISTLSKSNTFTSEKCPNSYYLNLLTYRTTSNPFVNTSNQTFNLNLYQYNKNTNHTPIDLKKVMMEIFPNKHENEIDNILEFYWNKEESYISIFSTLSLLIAYYSIEHHTSLLKSKSKILHEYREHIDILVNGDSINQYTISTLK